ncbi:MAG: hypothetical protein JXX29_02660, partial [Deltaproteobacteria bacterium]|nr:hypothetical protein [Deltaproteobacteria bacterium]MBN2670543.1 hypothetical protein [Deltaproteobacteria bacterium]
DVIREGTVFPDTDTAFVGALSQGTTYSDLVDAMEDIYGKGSDKELYFNEVSDKAGIDMNLNN